MWLKYHLHVGKVKLERVGQRSSPTPVRDQWAALGELQGSLFVLLLVLHCIVNLLADRSGSIFLPSCQSLRNLALSPPSLLAGFVSIFSD